MWFFNKSTKAQTQITGKNQMNGDIIRQHCSGNVILN